MGTTAYNITERVIGIKEIVGEVSNPQILAMLRLDVTWPEGDVRSNIFMVRSCSSMAPWVSVVFGRSI